MDKNEKNNYINNSKAVGGAIGATTSSAICILKANDIKNALNSFDKNDFVIRLGRNLEHVFQNDTITDSICKMTSGIVGTVITYPVIIPATSGIIAAGIGAIIGGKIAKGRLKYTNLEQKETNKIYRR